MANPLKAVSDLFRRTQQANVEAGRELERTRDRIAALHEERNAVIQAPRTRKEAEEAARGEIARLAKTVGPWFSRLAVPGGDMVDPNFKAAMARDPLAVTAAVNPEGLLAQVARGLDAVYAQRDGLSEQDKGARLRELKAERIELEKREEAHIRGLEAVGLPALRRADADPEIVLAADEELPQ